MSLEISHYERMAKLGKELLAWIISQHVVCFLSDRLQMDFLNSEAFLKEREDKGEPFLTYVLGQASPGIQKDKFDERFYTYFEQLFVFMTKDRDRWFPSSIYGEIKPIVTLPQEGLRC
jgi:hypothetical protein